MKNKNVIVSIDLETTGLYSGYHEICDMNCIAINIETWENIIQFHTTIKPMHESRIDQEALNINKFTIEQLRTFDHPNKAKGNFNLWWSCGLDNKKIEALGHNFVAFDKGFLEYWLNKKIYNNIFYHEYHDTKIIATYLKKKGILPKDLSTSLASLTDYFNIPHQPHNAYSDSMATILLYKKFLKL